MKITCKRCTMSFVVGQPRFTEGERLRCSDCNRPFWSEHNTKNDNKIRVGVFSKWLPEWEDERRHT